MAPFKRRPFLLIDAIQLELPWQDCDGRLFLPGDWLIKKDDGESYGVPKDMFKIHFEPATESDIVHVESQMGSHSWQSVSPNLA